MFDNKPRLTNWIVLTVALLIIVGIIRPEQLTVVLYKASLVTLGAVTGYWVDRALFPYGRPHLFLSLTDDSQKDTQQEITPAVTLLMLRRSIVVLACILGLTLGL